MEKLVNTMTTESTNNREAILFRMFFNDLAEITISKTRLNHSNGLFQTFSSSINQLFALGINITNAVSGIHVTMETLIVTSNIKVKNITILQRTLVRNAMTNDFIDRSDKYILCYLCNMIFSLISRLTCIQTWGICSSSMEMDKLHVQW